MPSLPPSMIELLFTLIAIFWLVDAWMLDPVFPKVKLYWLKRYSLIGKYNLPCVSYTLITNDPPTILFKR